MKCLVLSEKDYLLYKEIRLKALQSDPLYFGSTYEEEAMKSDDYFKNKVKFSSTHFVMGFYGLLLTWIWQTATTAGGGNVINWPF